VDRLIHYLHRLVSEAFFGTVTIGFQAGKVSTIRVERTLKLEDLPT